MPVETWVLNTISGIHLRLPVLRDIKYILYYGALKTSLSNLIEWYARFRDGAMCHIMTI